MFDFKDSANYPPPPILSKCLTLYEGSLLSLVEALRLVHNFMSTVTISRIGDLQSRAPTNWDNPGPAESATNPKRGNSSEADRR